MNSQHSRFTAITALALALGLTACTGTSPTTAPSESPKASTSSPSTFEESVPFNEHDVSFLQMMTVHHSGAMSMSVVMLNKEDIDSRVTDLAQEIMDAQGPEIGVMNGLLEEWGMQDAPMSDMSGMDHSTMDLAPLEEATGDDASRLFLEEMIIHHRDAVEMSEIQRATGASPDVLALAEKIIQDQQAEIELMERMLTELN